MFYNYFIIHYPSTIIFSFVLGMEEDKFQLEAAAATKDPGYQAQGKIQPFPPAPCREIASVPSTYKTS